MSTAALPVHVALVDTTGRIDPVRLAAVAGALSQQIAADFAPIWKVAASVGAYPAEAVTPGMWTIRLVDNIDEPGALGYHSVENGQPAAAVDTVGNWPKTVSHELCEMLADPWGMRMHQARLPDALASRYRDFGLARPTSNVSYLLEVADPCEATGYSVGGFVLSDFLHPAWYRSAGSPGVRYSHAGGCLQPRQVADGGYVSFAVGPDWFQAFNNGRRLDVHALGRFADSAHPSLRAWADEAARRHRTSAPTRPTGP